MWAKTQAEQKSSVCLKVRSQDENTVHSDVANVTFESTAPLAGNMKGRVCDSTSRFKPRTRQHKVEEWLGK